MYRVLVLLSFACVVFGTADVYLPTYLTDVDVAEDRDGGGHGQDGGHHAENHEDHHAEHNEVHHSETELHKEHRAGGPIENAIDKLEQQFFFLLRTVTSKQFTNPYFPKVFLLLRFNRPYRQISGLLM